MKFLLVIGLLMFSAISSGGEKDIFNRAIGGYVEVIDNSEENELPEVTILDAEFEIRSVKIECHWKGFTCRRLAIFRNGVMIFLENDVEVMKRVKQLMANAFKSTKEAGELISAFSPDEGLGHLPREDGTLLAIREEASISIDGQPIQVRKL
jgi:hypothetical protein